MPAAFLVTADEEEEHTTLVEGALVGDRVEHDERIAGA